MGKFHAFVFERSKKALFYKKGKLTNEDKRFYVSDLIHPGKKHEV